MKFVSNVLLVTAILAFVSLCYSDPSDVQKTKKKPCRGAVMQVNGRNDEGGEWDIRIGKINAVVEHYSEDGSADGEDAGEWEAIVYGADEDCEDEEVGSGSGYGPGSGAGSGEGSGDHEFYFNDDEDYS